MTPGNIQWNTTLGDLIGIVSAAVQVSDGEYALTGENYGLFLVKLDASGDAILNKTYTGMGDDFASSIFATSDGGYVLAGTMNAGTGAHLPSYAWLLRTDANGNVMWSQKYGAGDLLAATQTDDGEYAILAATSAGSVILAKIAASGQILWNQTYPDLQGFLGGFCSLVQASDGGYVMATSVAIISSSHNGFWLAKTDYLGNMQWNRTYTGPGSDTINWALIRTSDGGYAMIGNTNMNSSAPYAGGVRIWIQKTDASGTPQWSQTYGGPNGMNGRVIIQTKDGGYALAGGITEMYENSWPDFMYIAKLSSPQTSTFGAYIYAVAVAIVAAIVIMVIAVTIFLKRKRAPDRSLTPTTTSHDYGETFCPHSLVPNILAVHFLLELTILIIPPCSFRIQSRIREKMLCTLMSKKSTLSQ